jgi:hypothetical protein
VISNKSPTAITAGDILRLVENRVAESRTLEYKQNLPGGSDDERREFLADVSALANTVGGDILYGVVEERDAEGKTTGIPESAPGLPITGDVALRRLEEMVRDGIDPRVPTVLVQSIPGFANGAVVLLRLGRSWQRPHMVTFKNYSRFFARGASGKYQLDVQQIREAFVGAASLRDRVDAFRVERLQAVRENTTITPPLAEGGRIVLHVIPVAGFDAPENVDLDLATARPRPLFAGFGAGYHQINFDGVQGYELTGEGDRCLDYVQLFRNGTIEAVDAELLTRIARDPRRKGAVPSLSFEGRLIDSLARYLADLRDWRVPPPYLVGLSLLNVKALTFSMTFELADRLGGPRPIDRDDLVVREQLIENLGQDLRLDAIEALKPSFDILWQSVGIAKSPNFDDAGVWNAAGHDYAPTR